MTPYDVHMSDLALAFDPRPVKRRIGLVLLATDHTTERDFARMCPRDEVGIHANRIAYENPTTPENLLRMQPRLTAGAALILPGESLDALCYSCTAASAVIGDGAVEAAVQAAKPDVPVITPTGAARTALRALGATRISILAPYVAATGAAIAEYFVRHGFAVVNLVCLGLADDREMARVSPATIVTAARQTLAPEADALFISCTALRAAEVAEEIERELGKPVITSNQASVWLSLRKAGIHTEPSGFGRLFSLPRQVRGTGLG